MTLASGGSKRIRSAGQNPTAVKALLDRLEMCTPHLTFHEWRVSSFNDANANGHAIWKGQDNKNIEVALEATPLRLVATCHRDTGAISRDDHEFLGALAQEAQHAIRSARDGTISLVDFGSTAVAHEIRSRCHLVYDPLPALQFVRSLAQETYENQRLSYGLILTTKQGGTAPFAAAFENKRFKRLTDGFSTALVLDQNAAVMEITSLSVPPEEGTARQRRPWWAAALATRAEALSGVGVALTRNGDILVLHEGRLRFTQRAGRWKKWDHPAILTRLKSLWDFRVATVH